MKKWIRAAMLLSMVALLGLALPAQAKDGDISEALKAKYSPLIDAWKQSMEDQKFDQALKQMQGIKAGIEKEKELNPVHMVTLQVNAMLADTLAALKRWKDAEAVFMDLQGRLNARKKAESPEMLMVLMAQVQLFKAMDNPGKLRDTEKRINELMNNHPEWRELVEDKGGQEGEDPAAKEAFQKLKPEMEKIFQMMGEGRTDEALAAAAALADKASAEFGAENPFSLQARRIHAMMLQQAGQAEAAAELLDAFIKDFADKGLAPSMDLLYSLNDRAALWREAGDDAQAQALMDQLQASVEQKPELRAQWDRELAKQAENAKQEGPKDKGKPGRNQGYFEQLFRLNDMARDAKPADVVPKLEKLLEQARGELDPQDPFIIEGTQMLVRLLVEARQAERAVQLLQANIAALEPKAGPNQLALADSYRALGFAQDQAQNLAEAAKSYERAWQLAQKALEKAKDPAERENGTRILLQTGQEMAQLWFNQKRSADAQKLYQELFQTMAASPLTKPEAAAEFWLRAGQFQLGALKNPTEAQRCFQQAVEASRRGEKQDSGRQAEALRGLAASLEGLGRKAEAQKALEEARRLAPGPGPGPAPDPQAEAQDALRRGFDEANQLRGEGKLREANARIQGMVEEMRKRYGDKSRPYGLALIQRAYFQMPGSSEKPDARQLLEQGIAILEASKDQSREMADALATLGRLMGRQYKDPAKGEALLRRAVVMLRPLGPEGGVQYALSDLAQVLLQAKSKLPEVEKLYREAQDLDRQRQEPDAFWQALILPDLGQSYWETNRPAEAEKAWREAEARFGELSQRQPDFRPDYRGLYERLAQLYEKAGKKAEAQAYRDKLKQLR